MLDFMQACIKFVRVTIPEPVSGLNFIHAALVGFGAHEFPG